MSENMSANMSANIDETAGKPAIAYVGETPWHGLGQKVEDNATIEQIEVAAGLNWRANLTPVMFTDADGQLREMKHRVLYRDDTNAPLTIVGPEYQPFQNRDVLNFFRDYLAAGDMHIETAGALNAGRMVWALAKMKADYLLKGNDKVEAYVLLMNPHLYGKGGIAKLTEIRVVCQNTMTMALGGRGSEVKLWHNKEFSIARQNEIRDRLGIAHEKFNLMAEQAQILANAKIDAQAVAELAFDLFAPTADREDLDNAPKAVNRVIDLWNGEAKGSQLEAADGTAWGAFNAVTQYLDWERGRSPNSRLTYSWLGGGESVKAKARKQLLELVTVAR